MLCSPRGVPIVVDTYDTISVVVEDSVRFVFFGSIFKVAWLVLLLGTA